MDLPRFLFIALVGLVNVASAAEPTKPNILWITSEDHGPEMGCYGDQLARTPHVDALAAKGMKFRRAWSTAPVCAPARTAIISGIYPSSSGGIHMRSMVPLPAGYLLYPQYLRDAGYYCTNNSKTDYNLPEVGKVWDESSNKAHWRNRGAGQPFFAIFNSTKSHESQIRTRPHRQMTSPDDVRIPAYHPDTPEVRQDWAQYYDKVSDADADAGRHLRELEAAGFADDTIVFYYGDHGSGMPRSKRWPSNSGLHVPLVVYFPPKWEHLAPKEYQAGGTSDRLVGFVDLAPTVLSIAGVQPPEWMQGHAFAGPYQTAPPQYLYGERGRMDERMDMVRSITDGRYVYLRNFYPHVSQAQRVAYQFETPTTRVWYDRFVAGQTNVAQSLFWQVPKAVEEMYDLDSDRDEVVNLASSPEHRAICDRLRHALRDHMLAVRDTGVFPELEMHLQSAGSTPYQLAHRLSPETYLQVLQAAEIASQLDVAADTELQNFLMGDNPSLRYWGALGYLIRGKTTPALVQALHDASPAVRIVAAEAVLKFGPPAAQTAALHSLGELADPQTSGVLTSMQALAAIEALGPVAQGLSQRISTLPQNGPSPHARYNSYVPRLLENIAAQRPARPGTPQ